MGLRAYFLVNVNADIRQREFLKALQEIENIPGVDFVDPVIGSRDMVIMVDTSITVDALARKIQTKPWVKNIEVLRIASTFERHKTTKVPLPERIETTPIPELLNC